ncbi:hypothetical protein [uncultured Bacteroides sp.]|uniref:hypothetical protein n=1 Tax=uncultured Bacteroides sp. TaxID=162156 RepID=UPI002AAC1D13|nr:hypothetical protein [uncultured Bacteroides sp.]
MELDELKKSWEVLDNRLKKKELIDEQTLSNLISERTKQTRSSMNKILLYAKTTLIVGFLALIGLGSYLLIADYNNKEFCLWLFIWIMLCIGMVWDSMGYMYLKSIDIEKMPLIIVIKKMTAYHRNFIIECFVAAVFFLSAFVIQAFCIQLFTLNFVSILIFSIVWIIGCIVAIWIIKSLFYNKLRNIKRNLAELGELNQD